jgi:predicted GTPase
MKINVDEIYQISAVDGITLDRSLIKLGEEVGELNAAHLAFVGSPNKSKSSDANILEEGTDVLMCDLDYLFKAGFTVDDINDKLIEKCAKWKAKFVG